jgi:uncharacterized protein YbaA (DUF1428 family)
MTYVYAYLGPVPKERKAEYFAHAARMAKVFKAHGATRVTECWGEDIDPGKLTSFPRAVDLKDGEALAYGWQEWPDKAAADAGMEAAFGEPEMGDMNDVPMDGPRMIFAGFEMLVDE